MAKYCPYCASHIPSGDSCTECDYSANYRPKSHHLKPGTLLNNRYLVGVALGEGGFGITYLGRDLALDMKVAIKEYFPVSLAARSSDVTNCLSLSSQTSGAEFINGRSRILDEAQTIAKMEKADAVVTVRDFFEENNSAYIVMEFVDGKDLKAILTERNQPLSSDELFVLLEPVFAALAELHRLGLIHRDISPDNIMVENGKARLIDFGGSVPSAQESRISEAILKHRFSPVEQYRNEGMGPWTDVYAMGATIYYCLTGKLPPNAIDRISSDTLQSPSALGVKLTSQQEKALMKALAVQPDDRYRTMEEFGKDLFIHRNRSRIVSIAAGLVAAAAVCSLIFIRPGTRVETLESARTPARIAVSAEELTGDERNFLSELEQTIRSSVTISDPDDFSYLMSAENTTGTDLTDVSFYARIIDKNGIVRDYAYYKHGDWPSGSTLRTRLNMSTTSPNPDHADMTVFCTLNGKTVKTDFQELSIPAESSSLEIIVDNVLPATITYTGYSAKASVRITDVQQSRDGSYIMIGGEMVSSTLSGTSQAYLNYKLTSESGAVISTGTITPPVLRNGERFFDGSAISLYDLKPGTYHLLLSDYVFSW